MRRCATRAFRYCAPTSHLPTMPTRRTWNSVTLSLPPRQSEAQPNHPRGEEVEGLTAEFAGGDGRPLIREIRAVDGELVFLPRVADVCVHGAVAAHRNRVLFVEIAMTHVSRDRSRA